MASLVFICILILPELSSAYVIPHPQERAIRPNPRVELVRTKSGESIRSSRGTLFYRFRPDVKDDRLKKPSRRQMAQLKQARMDFLRRSIRR